jgi:16S rRNA (guanine1207-N2)-methyltransferase
MSTYREWLAAPVTVGTHRLRIASKPGVMAHGARDEAAFMLAEAIPQAGPSAMPGVAAVWQSGNGLVPAMAAAQGWDVCAIDRHVANAEATRRTLGLDEDATSGAANVGISPHAVSHAVWHAASFAAAALDNPHAAPVSNAALALIRLPTDRVSTELVIGEAFRTLAIGGQCFLAGANDEGAKPAARLLEACFGNVQVEAQRAGHRLLVARKVSDEPSASWTPSPWQDVQHRQRIDGPMDPSTGEPLAVWSRPGVFSWEHADEATTLLADRLDVQPGERVIDLGCGAGALGVLAAKCNAGAPVLLLDADSEALRCARWTAESAGVLAPQGAVQVRASDVAAAASERVHVVITNPPFHVGKATNLQVPQAFIDEAHAQLLPGGRLLLVANRTLPYERLMAERFGNVHTLHDGRRFKVLAARRKD